MGKKRTRFIGIDEIEEKQKEESKLRADRKKAEKVEDKKPEPEVGAIKRPKKDLDSPKSKNNKTHGKNYNNAVKKIDLKKSYKLLDAVELLKKMKYSKFDESIEVHIRTTEDGLRGSVTFPHSIGRIVRVVIVDDKIIENIADGKLEFDVLISHPSYMPKLAKFARTLGPKGLMPNPKAGTISTEPEIAAKKYMAGNVNWKNEPKFPLIHQMVGKISLGSKEIAENISALVKSIDTKKIVSLHIASTMTPGLKIEIDSV